MCFGYFLNPENLTHFTILIGTAFVLYFIILITAKDKQETDVLLWISMIFRLIFIAAIPLLSTDFWRLIWDSKLFISGVNPNLFSPAELIEFTNQNEMLHTNIINGTYSFSSVFKLLFGMLGAMLSNYSIVLSVILFRIPILIAEFITIKYIRKLLEHFHLPHYHVLWYALNPVVIIILTGNLYLEGIVLMFLVVSFYWMIINKWVAASLLWGLAASISLLPLLIFPAIIKRLGAIKGFWFLVISLFVTSITYLPICSIEVFKINLFSFQQHLIDINSFSTINILSYTLGLFENYFVPKLLVILSIIIISIIYFFKNGSWELSFNKVFFGYTAYLLLLEETEPIHIVCLLLFSVFTKNHVFAILWSCIILSSDYLITTSNIGLIISIKLIVFCWLVFELFRNKQLTD